MAVISLGLRLSLDLTQGQGVLRGPSADQMHGSLATRAVVRTPGRLAVNGDHLTGHQLRDGLGPGHQAVLELGWVQTGKDIAEEPAPAKAGVSWEGIPPGNSRKV